MTLTANLTTMTIPDLLEALRSMAADGLPRENEIARNIKNELVQRGIPRHVIENLIEFCRIAEEIGGRVSFGEERPEQRQVLTVTVKIDYRQQDR